jgi:MinD-like ATPase involved in chromosome partitioning or flagellar assembly
MLVDADLARRDLSKRLGVKEFRGLGECVQAGGAALETCLLRSETDGLEVIPAGLPASGDAEWTRRGSERLVAGLRRLALPNAVVLIDTPPLLVAPVAHLLAEHADHVLFVVGAGQASVDDIRLAAAQIPSQERVGLILNRTAASQPAAGYGYAQLK